VAVLAPARRGAEDLRRRRDRGRRARRRAGTIDELTGGGVRTIDVVATPPARATGLLVEMRDVVRAGEHEDALRVELSPEAPPTPETVTALMRRLLDGGIEIERVAPATSSLEARFLAMTTRTEDRS
jgi:hypothetical protein